VRADRSLLLRAEAAIELLRRDPDVDRVELLIAVVWPTAALANLGELRGCRSCRLAFEPKWRRQYLCGSADCAREAANARMRAYTRRKAAA
jgi:hypothetical protein